MRIGEKLIRNGMVIVIPWLVMPFLWCANRMEPWDQYVGFRQEKLLGLYLLYLLCLLAGLWMVRFLLHRVEQINSVALVIGALESVALLLPALWRVLPYRAYELLLRNFGWILFLYLAHVVLCAYLFAKKRKQKNREGEAPEA